MPTYQIQGLKDVWFYNSKALGVHFIEADSFGFCINFSESYDYQIDIRNNITKGSLFSLPEALSFFEILDIKIVDLP